MCTFYTHTIEKKYMCSQNTCTLQSLLCIFSTIFNPLSDKRLKTLNNPSTVLMLNNIEITPSRDRVAILPRTFYGSE